MSLLCRYAGGLACLVTVLALVGCGGGPGSQPEPKPIENIAFSQGEKVRTISLSDKFNGTDLTYSATTSNRSVATVTVDNDKDTLTVTVVGTGTAAITVTAKNSDGEAKQTFTVTVPKPPPAPDPEPVDIPDIPSLEKDATRPIPLGDKFSGENLTYSASSSHDHVVRVTVDNTANTLTLTAVGPGQAIITVTATATAQGSTPQTKTFTVTVPQPASEATAPTVKTGATSTVSVAVGATSTVTLSTVFDGATSYTATSSASTIATASGASSGTLTITGVSVGSATITVTATNTAGSSPAHAIAVTVTAPVTTTPPTTSSSCKSPLTIELHETAKCTLSSKEQILTPSPDESEEGVTIARVPGKDTEWSIRAEKKGSHTVFIISTGESNSGAKLGEIEVEVPNSHPILKNAAHKGIIIDLEADIPMHNTDTDLSLPSTYFSDPDDRPTDTPPVIDVEYYRIASKPDWFLIDTEDGFVKNHAADPITGYQLNYEVLKEVKVGIERLEYDFTVALYGSDGEDDSSLTLVLKFNAPAVLSPNGKPYTLTQRGDKSNFYNDAKLDSPPANRLDVGPRRGVSHTVTFTHPAGVDATGFGFANSLHQKWQDDDRLPETGDGSSVTTAAAHYLGEDGNYVLALPDETGDDGAPNRVEGKDYFILRSTGAVVAKWASDPALGGTPAVEFELKETGSTGTIKIEYHVWTLSRDRKTKDGAPDPDDPREEIPTTKRSDSRTLTINIVKCSSPPDTIAACP